MSLEKVIQVNPDYLQIKSKTKSANRSPTRKKRVRQKPASSTTLKKEFIQMIKNKKATQQRGDANADSADNKDNVKNVLTNGINDGKNSESEFLTSLKDLNKIISGRKSRKQRRVSKPNININQISTVNSKHTNTDSSSVVPVQLDAFDNMVNLNEKTDVVPLVPRCSNIPKYGLLKNGKKPLFSQLNKTVKRNVSFPEKSPVCSVTTCDKMDVASIRNEDNLRKKRLLELQRREQINNKVNSTSSLSHSPVSHNITDENSEELEAKLDSIIERRHKNSLYGLDPLNNNTSIQTTLNPTPNPNPQPIKTKKQIKRLQKTCKIGKKGRTVNVMIDNNKTRRRIMNDINKLDKISIPKMKEYLREKSLIQKGSDAPDFIIKQLYKSAIMTGSVENTNKSNLINEINSNLMGMEM